MITEHTPNCQNASIFLPLHVFGRVPQALLGENNEGAQLELLLISSFFFLIWSALMTRLTESQKTIPKWDLHKDARVGGGVGGEAEKKKKWRTNPFDFLDVD